LEFHYELLSGIVYDAARGSKFAGFEERQGILL